MGGNTMMVYQQHRGLRIDTCPIIMYWEGSYFSERTHIVNVLGSIFWYLKDKEIQIIRLGKQSFCQSKETYDLTQYKTINYMLHFFSNLKMTLI